MLNRYGSLAAFMALAVLATAAGALYEAGEWYYRALSKPGWTPPAWLHAAAWAVAYVAAALGAWQAWLSEHPARTRALGWWLGMLALNITFSWLYLSLHRPGWAWLAAGLGLAAAVVCTASFRKFSGQAAGLMTPILLWLAFLWAHTLVAWTLSGGILLRLMG